LFFNVLRLTKQKLKIGEQNVLFFFFFSVFQKFIYAEVKETKTENVMNVELSVTSQKNVGKGEERKPVALLSR
jgi:hypothetical protein